MSHDLFVTEQEKKFLGNISEDSDIKSTISKFPKILEINANRYNSKLFNSHEVKRN